MERRTPLRPFNLIEDAASLHEQLLFSCVICRLIDAFLNEEIGKTLKPGIETGEAERKRSQGMFLRFATGGKLVRHQVPQIPNIIFGEAYLADVRERYVLKRRPAPNNVRAEVATIIHMTLLAFAGERAAPAAVALHHLTQEKPVHLGFRHRPAAQNRVHPVE